MTILTRNPECVLPLGVAATSSEFKPSNRSQQDWSPTLDALERMGLDNCLVVIRSGGDSPKDPGYRNWQTQPKSIEFVRSAILNGGCDINGRNERVTGFGIMPHFTNRVAFFDVDGPGAVDALIDAGFYDEFLSATNNGFATTSGKHKRWSVMVLLPDREIGNASSKLSCGIGEDGKPMALELFNGYGQHVMLPGSLHSSSPAGNNHYSLISSGDPQPLSAEFWDWYLSSRDGGGVIALPVAPVARSAAIDVTGPVVGGSHTAARRVNAVCEMFPSAKDAYLRNKQKLPFSCPAHDDSSPSAFINVATGGVKCSAGCRYEDVENSLTELCKLKDIEWAPYRSGLGQVPDRPVNKLSRRQRRSIENAESMAVVDDSQIARLTEIVLEQQDQISYLMRALPTYNPVQELAIAANAKRYGHMFWDRQRGCVWAYDASDQIWKSDKPENLIKRTRSALMDNDCVSSMPSRYQVLSFLTQLNDLTESGESIEAYQSTVHIPTIAFADCFVISSGERAGEVLEVLESEEFSQSDESLDGCVYAYQLYKTGRLHFSYDQSSDFSYFWNWLVELFSGDESVALVVLAWLGCVLFGVGFGKHQKYLFVTGEAGIGKGTLSKIAQRFAESVCTIDDLPAFCDSSHSQSSKIRYRTDGKKLAVFNDASPSLDHEFFKGFTAGEDYGVAGVYRDSYEVSSQNMNALIESNHRVVFPGDRAGSIQRRQMTAVANASMRMSGDDFEETLLASVPAVARFLINEMGSELCLRIVRNHDRVSPMMAKNYLNGVVTGERSPMMLLVLDQVALATKQIEDLRVKAKDIFDWSIDPENGYGLAKAKNRGKGYGSRDFAAWLSDFKSTVRNLPSVLVRVKEGETVDEILGMETKNNVISFTKVLFRPLQPGVEIDSEFETSFEGETADSQLAAQALDLVRQYSTKVLYKKASPATYRSSLAT